MMTFFKKIIPTIFLVGIISCETNRPDATLQRESLTQGETARVDIILNKLYQSFSYGKAEEPNWELMRSVFIDGAQFVSETPAGQSPHSQTIEEFISSWQHSIRDKNSPTLETTERLIEINTYKIGRLIHVDVVFQASKSSDPKPRKTGLDSLVLANVDGVWKILSFVVHYESKL